MAKLIIFDGDLLKKITVEIAMLFQR